MTTIEQNFITLEGAHVAWWRRGRGLPAILFLAGGLCDCRSWLPQFKELKQDWQLLAMDPRGCGMSFGAGPYDVNQQAKDALTLLEIVGHPAIVVSHSLGGYAALALHALNPQLVAANVFIDVPLSPAGVNTSGIVAALERAGNLEPLSGMITSMSSTANAETSSLIKSMMNIHSVEVAIGMMSGFESIALEMGQHVRNVSMKPVMTIWPGLQPKGGNPQWLDSMVPGIHQEYFQDTGHFVQLERAVEVCRLIEKFAISVGTSD